MKFFSILAFLYLFIFLAFAQPASFNPNSTKPLQSNWVKHPDLKKSDASLVWFRNVFLVENVPSECWIRVSGDHRYRIYLNGVLLGVGPARSDALHWRYEWYNLSPYLKQGQNLLAAEQWSYGDKIPNSFTTVSPGL